MRNYTLRNGKAKTLSEELKLVARVKAGDKQAQNELVEVVKAQISGVVLSYKKTFSVLGIDEDDAVQRLLVKLPVIVQNYDEERTDFCAYVKTCARNLFNTVCTKRRKTVDAFVPIDDGAMTLADGGKAISDFESEEIVKKFFSEAKAILNENEYKAIVFFGNGYSYEEIASALGVERKKVDNLLYSARKKIKRNEEFFKNLLK